MKEVKFSVIDQHQSLNDFFNKDNQKEKDKNKNSTKLEK